MPKRFQFIKNSAIVHDPVTNQSLQVRSKSRILVACFHARGIKVLPHLPDTEIRQRFADIQRQIAQGARQGGRSPEDVTIVAVTKTHPVDALRKARAIGITNFGENRVQEAVVKLSNTEFVGEDSGISLHLIGHLQRNKVRKAVQVFDSIDSIDSLELAKTVSSEVRRARKSLRVLLEVNTSGEPQKQGIQPPETLSLAQAILGLPGLKLAGLMTVGPLTNDIAAIRNSFKQLKILFEQVKAELDPPAWSALSMGMSGDFEIAIEEGATEIRLGTALFGQRSYTP